MYIHTYVCTYVSMYICSNRMYNTYIYVGVNCAMYIINEFHITSTILLDVCIDRQDTKQ